MNKITLFIVSLMFPLLAHSSIISGVEEIPNNGITVGNYQSSYDTGSNTFSYQGGPFSYRTDCCIDGITNGNVKMEAQIDSFGNLLGGSFSATGGIASLLLPDDSLLLEGNVVRHNFDLSGIGEVFKHDFLIELTASNLPNFDTGFALLDNHYVSWAFGGQPAIDMVNLFSVDWGPRGAPLHTFIHPANYTGIPEPSALLLLAIGLILLTIKTRSIKY